MKTITIRDLRQRWPETEKRLQAENELLIERQATAATEAGLEVVRPGA